MSALTCCNHQTQEITADALLLEKMRNELILPEGNYYTSCNNAS